MRALAFSASTLAAAMAVPITVACDAQRPKVEARVVDHLDLPAFAPIAPFFAAWILHQHIRAHIVWLRNILAVLVLVLSSCAVVLPWTYRNYLRYHEFILVSASSASPFWEGNLREYPSHFQEQLRNYKLHKK